MQQELKELTILLENWDEGSPVVVNRIIKNKEPAVILYLLSELPDNPNMNKLMSTISNYLIINYFPLLSKENIKTWFKDLISNNSVNIKKAAFKLFNFTLSSCALLLPSQQEAVKRELIYKTGNSAQKNLAIILTIIDTIKDLRTKKYLYIKESEEPKSLPPPPKRNGYNISDIFLNIDKKIKYYIKDKSIPPINKDFASFLYKIYNTYLAELDLTQKPAIISVIIKEMVRGSLNPFKNMKLPIDDLVKYINTGIICLCPARTVDEISFIVRILGKEIVVNSENMNYPLYTTIKGVGKSLPLIFIHSRALSVLEHLQGDEKFNIIKNTFFKTLFESVYEIKKNKDSLKEVAKFFVLGFQSEDGSLAIQVAKIKIK